MDKRRASPRRRTLLGAQIAFNDGASAIGCTVKSLSHIGALLSVASPVGVPGTFTLRLTHEDAALPCRIVRRSINSLGVAFDRRTA